MWHSLWNEGAFLFSNTHLFESGGFKHKFYVLSRLTFTLRFQMGHFWAKVRALTISLITLVDKINAKECFFRLCVTKYGSQKSRTLSSAPL